MKILWCERPWVPEMGTEAGGSMWDVGGGGEKGWLKKQEKTGRTKDPGAL